MQLLELTPAEIAFLKAPAPPSSGLPARLTHKLAATLSARLRLPVQAMAQPAPELADVPMTPAWLPDATLAALWLPRRLGGRSAVGGTSFVPGSFVRTLDAEQAKSWLDAPGADAQPPAQTRHNTTTTTQAR